MFSLNLVKGIDDRNGGYENTQGRVLKSIDSDGTISKKNERYTMVKPIMKDIFFLGQKSEEATVGMRRYVSMSWIIWKELLFEPAGQQKSHFTCPHWLTKISTKAAGRKNKAGENVSNLIEFKF